MRAAFGAVAVALLGAAGCRREPTYHDDVEPVLAASCVGCHRTGGVAPTPKLETYEQAKAAAGKIALSVQSRDMPPWGADDTGICRRWKRAAWLSDDAVRTLVRWASGNAERGAARPKSGGPPPEPFSASGVVLDTGGDYAPELGQSTYRCFVADPKLSSDRLASAFRVVSTEPRSVAQMTLYALDSDATNAEATALDDREPGLGYSCYGSSRVDGARLVASWTWGNPVLRLPAGVGIPLARGRKAVIQIHYDPIATGLGVPTRTRVELELDDRAKPARFVPVSPSRMSLAPGERFVQARGEAPVTRRMTVLGVAPRMHTLGRTMELDRVQAGKQECVASFDHWHFYRQRLFEYADPLELEPGDVLRVSCLYNTQSRTSPTEMGESIDQEQCLASLLVSD